MRLNEVESRECKALLRGRGLDVTEAARLIDVHRTTLHKRLAGATEITPVDMLEMGIRIGAGQLRQARL